jgi:hypothetical protein
MTTLKNYSAVNSCSYENHEETEPTLKEKICSMTYPVIGIMAIYYQIYLLLFA